ncbi:pig-Q, partial [Massospora cicadina]
MAYLLAPTFGPGAKRFDPSTICVTGVYPDELDALRQRLRLYNETRLAKGRGFAFQVLGQLHFSGERVGGGSVKPSDQAGRAAGGAEVWITAVYGLGAGQAALELGLNQPQAPTATVIYYQKPTGDGGPFYAMRPFGTPALTCHQLPLLSHCSRHRAVGEDPVLKSLVLINGSHTLDTFLAGKAVAAVNLGSGLQPDTLHGGRLPWVANYSSTARQVLSRVRGLRRGFRRPDLLWHILLDTGVGGMVAVALVRYCDPEWVAATVDFYTVALLKSFVGWLMGYPAGLKINLGLASFLGELILWLIYLWVEWTHRWKGFAWGVVWLVGGVGAVFGVTGALALVSDLLFVATLHLRWFYSLESGIYAWHFSLIQTLYHLFRGKKRNALQRRIDSCGYDVEQLILGTILFTILIFLFPTIAVYYAVAVSAWVATLAVVGAVEVVLSLINHFPAYAVVRRLVSPSSLPHRVHLDLLSPPPSSQTSGAPGALTTVDFELKSVPLPLSAVFAPYALIFRHVARSFQRADLVTSLLTGKQIHPLPRFEVTRPRLWIDLTFLASPSEAGAG